MGNICRSPTAEGIMRALVDEADLGERITVDSAATSTDELGRPVDRRSVKEAARRGITLEHTAWQFQRADYDRYDLIVVVDGVNMKRMRRLARDEKDASKLRLLRGFEPAFDPRDPDVPDPWHGDEAEFVHVFDVIEAACRGLLEHLR